MGASVSSISVVIPTHGRRSALPEMMEALADQASSEVVVVVNASDDGSYEYLAGLAEGDPRIKPVYVEEPGAANARQVGVERASGDIVLMLDDDVIPEPGLVAGHLRHHQREPGTVLVGYMPVTEPPHRRAGEYPADLYSRTYERVCDDYERDPATIFQALWFGNVSMRRSDCLRIGMLPAELPDFYAYHEDLDFGLRCLDAGLDARFDRSLLAHHHYRKSPAGFIKLSHESGLMRATIHARHPEEVGELQVDHFEQGTSGPGRLLVRAARHRGFYRPVAAALKGVTGAAGRLGRFRLESYAGHLLGTVEQQRAAFRGDRPFPA